MFRNTFTLCFLLLVIGLPAQILIEGYVFEDSNRGYIDNAEVTLSPMGSEQVIGFWTTAANGQYRIEIASAGEYKLHINKRPYFEHNENIKIAEGMDKVFYRHELKRNPGYIFEITLAEKDPALDSPKDALKGALIEVYNNTKRQEELVIEDYQGPEFKVDLIKGSHYTLLIRKDGFISKRLEAFVDMQGCILCFEGVGKVEPGVSDNLSQNNTIGVLLANIELERVYEGKKFGIDNIYYDLNKSAITKDAARELHKVAVFLKDNPELRLELGSHTDTRGKDKYNLKLSEARAKEAVEFLVNKSKISQDRLSFKGYGEAQLANHCISGVNCSEEEHQENRRTELKVIDFLTIGDRKSLRQLKTEEFMNQILAELEQEGQVQVADGENIEKVISENSSVKRSTRKLEDVFNEAAAAELKEQAEHAAAERIEKDSAVGFRLEHEQKAMAKQKSELKGKERLAQERMAAEKRQKEAKAQDVQISQVETYQSLKTIKSSEVTTIQTASKDKADLSNYTGYKIVLIFSRYELPDIHPIYSDHSDLVIYTTADGNKLYMIGNFKSKLDATKAMLKGPKEEYPQAYVVGFEKGIRTF